MKKILFLAALLLAFSACQMDPNCCQAPKSPTAAFAALANDPAFRSAHPAPGQPELVHGGTMIEFPVAGGANGHGYLIKAHGNTNKYLLLFHEWWGLNDYMRNEASYWVHQLGINVLAVDLYDGKTTNNPDEAGKLMQACDETRARAIIDGAAKYAGEGADFRTMGWCFGGGWSLQATLQLKDKVKACVMYYGMPEKDAAKLKTLNTDVLFIHPEQDKWITGELVSEFEKNMQTAGKTVTVKHYDADHAFANPSSPRYNEAAARQAREVVGAYLKDK